MLYSEKMKPLAAGSWWSPGELVVTRWAGGHLVSWCSPNQCLLHLCHSKVAKGCRFLFRWWKFNLIAQTGWIFILSKVFINIIRISWDVCSVQKRGVFLPHSLSRPKFPTLHSCGSSFEMIGRHLIRISHPYQLKYSAKNGKPQKPPYPLNLFVVLEGGLISKQNSLPPPP